MTTTAAVGPATAEPADTRAAARVGSWRWWLRVWGWAFAVYTVLAVLTTVQNALNTINAGRAVLWPLLLTNRVLEEYSCALFVPPIFLLVHHFPLDRSHWRGSAPMLLLATTGFVVAKYLLMQPLLYLLFPRHASPVGSAIAANMLAVLLDFATVVAVAQALEFNRQARERERTAAELRERLTHARLETLRSQLQPHFLFNTLNGAATLMHTDVDAADRMLTQLADLLRATLGPGGAHEIPLDSELELLDRYLAIMRVRFRDRLTVVLDVAAEARGALVPPFLLQPLVENALEHGIVARPGPGRVEIRAAREGDRLLLSITDDGPGPGGRTPPESGIGLGNTRARLAQLYGDDQRLALEPAGPGGGARVTVWLPYRAAPGAGTNPRGRTL